MSWSPHPGAQTEFLERGEFEVLYGGAAGGGKTDCLIMEALRFVHHPQYRAVILRRTFPQLQEIIDRCWHFYPQIGGVYRSTEHRWYFDSGAVINLGHMQHENDRYSYQGKEYQFIGFDELTQFLETQYLYLHSRARSSVEDLPPRIRATTNPGGAGHSWVKRRFIDIAPPGTTYVDPDTGLSRTFIPSRVYDNPSLMEADPAYVARLKALPDIERKRLLEGDWDSFDGQFFEDLSQRVHSCEPFEVPPEWTRFMVLDWGYSKPFSVGWYAVDYDGVLYRYREWYGCKDGEEDVGLRMTAQEVARGIRERETERVPLRIADPSIWNKTSSARRNESIGPSVQEDMAAEGLYFMKADNDRINGWQQVHRRLRLDPEIDHKTGEILSEMPMFLAFSDQEHFWRTMPKLQQDRRNPDDADTDQEDHIADEVRYACMHRPVQPRKVEQFPVNSITRERQKLKRARELARSRGISLHEAYQRVR